MVILAITGFNETAGSVDIRTRLKYSDISSGTASSRIGTITVWVVEEGLNVRSSDIMGKSFPAILREKSQNFTGLLHTQMSSDSLLRDSPIAVLFVVCKVTMISLARIPLSKDTATVTLPTSSLTE